jgi:hypothetical protein
MSPRSRERGCNMRDQACSAVRFPRGHHFPHLSGRLTHLVLLHIAYRHAAVIGDGTRRTRREAQPAGLLYTCTSCERTTGLHDESNGQRGGHEHGRNISSRSRSRHPRPFRFPSLTDLKPLHAVSESSARRPSMILVLLCPVLERNTMPPGPFYLSHEKRRVSDL